MAITDNYAPDKTIGNGVTTAFSGNWNVINEDYFRVYLESVATGVQTLVSTSDYSLTFDADGYIVTMNTAPSSSFYLIRARDVALDQTSPYRTSKGFQGEVVENSFDKLTAIAQDLNDIFDRTPQLPLGSTSTLSLAEPTGAAGKYLIVNDDEDGFDYAVIADGVTGVAISAGDSFKPVVVNGTEDGFIVSSSSQLSQIIDTNDNEIIKFAGVASAVNEITITNSATASSPKIEATGGDASINVIFQSKGAGIYQFNGTASTAAAVRLFENTANGTNYVAISAPAGVTSNYTAIMPAALPASKKGINIDNAGTLTFDGTGVLVQQAFSQISTVTTTTTVIPNDNTIPQNTEGAEFLTRSITPTSATNLLKITYQVNVACSTAFPAAVALFQDSTANALDAHLIELSTATSNFNGGRSFVYYMTAGTTSATTFKVRCGPTSAGTLTFNGASGAGIFGGVMFSSIQVEELAV